MLPKPADQVPRPESLSQSVRKKIVVLNLDKVDYVLTPQVTNDA